MRKLSEVRKASEARHARNRERQSQVLDRMNAWMDELDARDIPCKNNSDATTRRFLRKRVRSGTCHPIGIECDDCGTEMVNLNETLMTLPPRAKIQCPGCGVCATVDPEDL